MHVSADAYCSSTSPRLRFLCPVCPYISASWLNHCPARSETDTSAHVIFTALQMQVLSHLQIHTSALASQYGMPPPLRRM